MSVFNHTDLAANNIEALASHVTGPDGQLDQAIGDRADLTLSAPTASLVEAVNDVVDYAGTSLDTDGTLKAGAVDVAAVVADGILTDAKLGADIKVGSLAALATTIKTSVVAAMNELVGSIAAIAGGATVTANRLKEWTEAAAYELTALTYSATYPQLVSTATVKWPDGSAGTFTSTTFNSTFGSIDAYTVSHTTSGKTVTQAAITRNSAGQATAKPALTVTP